jgi:hypothetical protein
MIGNKKIEEAARLDDKEYYDRLSDNDKCFFEYGFRRGYNRALKDLWHPNSEEPKHHSYIIYKTANNNGFGTEYIDCSWKMLTRCFQITHWLYVDDLLPKEGGEQ